MTPGPLLVFRSYPQPGESWRPWKVYADAGSAKGGRGLGPGGCLSFQLDDCPAQIRFVDDEGESHALSISSREDAKPRWVVVGRHRSLGKPFIKPTQDLQDIPKSLIPRFGPNGKEQSFAAGLSRAYLSLAVLVALGLVLLGGGIAAISSSFDGRSLVAFFLLCGPGAIILAKSLPSIRLLWYQRSWPLTDWRIDEKCEGISTTTRRRPRQ